MKIGFGEFCCLFTRAQFDFDWGKEETAWINLRKALSLGKEIGFTGIYIDRPASTARVCLKALEAGVEVDYIQEMIRERNLMPEQPPVASGKLALSIEDIYSGAVCHFQRR